MSNRKSQDERNARSAATSTTTGADTPSAVAFAAAMRPHIALAVRDLEASVAFYQHLLDCPPSKVRDGYAKFEPAMPALHLSLNVDPEHAGQRGVAHFGIQVQSSAAVHAAADRLADAGMTLQLEDGVTCCFSRQDKVWAIDPDGHRWEIFVVTAADSPVHSLPRAEGAPACCATAVAATAVAASTVAASSTRAAAGCCG